MAEQHVELIEADAAVLADLAALRLEQGDAQGSEHLFRRALAAQQQQQQQQQLQEHLDADGAAASTAAVEEGSWEAWDEASAPLYPQPVMSEPAVAIDADNWEVAAAAMPVPPSCHGRLAAASSGGVSGGGAGGLPFGGGHVLEFFDLTPAVRTQHLEACLERFCGSHPVPPTLKWVDDCHAVVVCSDPKAARQLLETVTRPSAAPEFCLRGYADASSGTRKLTPEELQPPKPRPSTSAAVARRLIGGALNLRLRDKDAEQQLLAKQRRQRQEREERQKALDAAWYG